MSRKKKILKPKPSYAVVGDGETEFFYLQMLKRYERNNLAIDIKPEIAQKKSVV